MVGGQRAWHPSVTVTALRGSTRGCALLDVFFFQAEDGIRDYKVTGVQTCALPIYTAVLLASSVVRARPARPAGPGPPVRHLALADRRPRHGLPGWAGPRLAPVARRDRKSVV